MNILSHPSFDKTLFELKTYLEEVHRYCDFNAQSQEQSNSNNIAFSCQEVKKSSQDASIIGLQQEKVKKSAITVYFFNCKVDEMEAYTHNVYKDVTYKMRWLFLSTCWLPRMSILLCLQNLNKKSKKKMKIILQTRRNKKTKEVYF